MTLKTLLTALELQPRPRQNLLSPTMTTQSHFAHARAGVVISRGLWSILLTSHISSEHFKTKMEIYRQTSGDFFFFFKQDIVFYCSFQVQMEPVLTTVYSGKCSKSVPEVV